MARLSFRQMVRGADVGLLTITLILVLFGLAALFSFSFNSGGSTTSLLYKQGAFAVISFALALLVIRLDYRWLGGIHWALYGVAVATLILVLIFGRTVNGTTGWFEFFGVQLQPVELVKVFLAIVMAKYLADHAHTDRYWRLMFMSGAIVALPVGLIMLQPDLGSALIILGMWVGLLFVIPLPRRYLAYLFLSLAAVAVVSWFTILKPYQKDRILNFVSPGRDRLGSGYNVQQAMTAIGSGELLGRGLGLGSQSQLNFLPARQTDFIFASVSEELGFVGGGMILALYWLLFWRLRRVVVTVRDDFSLLLASGVALMFFLQVIINVGMNLGLFPVTGIPLPFLSYGGSSLLASLLAIGLLESLVIRQRTAPL